MTAMPRFAYRRTTYVKRCPACAAAMHPTLRFCTSCGANVSQAPQVSTSGSTTSHFEWPAYLLANDPLNRPIDEEPAGTGLIWLGVLLTIVPAATGNLSPVTLGLWGTGIATVIAGFLRARSDNGALIRGGMVTAAAAILTLAIFSHQVTRDRAQDDQEPGPRAIAAATETREEQSDESLANSSVVPMSRGDALHTGAHPGPGIDGNPYREWHYETGAALRSAPAIDNGTAFIGTGDGYLVALDLLTGRVQWRADLGGYPVSSTPAVSDRSVFVGSGYALVALDQARGSKRWSFPMSYAGESSPTVMDGVVYAASKEHFVYAIDALSGERLWSYRTDGLIFGSPTATHDLVLVGGDDGDIFALERENGTLRWKYQAEAGVYSTIAAGDELLFVTLRNGTVLAIDMILGTVAWEFPTGGDASPALAGDTVYVAGDDGAVYALDAESGLAPMWVYPTGSRKMLSPVVSDDVLYVAAGPTLFAIDRESGDEAWRYPLGDSAASEPVVVDEFIYIGTEKGRFLAITGDGHLATPPAETAD
jgi:eukaryotic-like serine/threonine-protein kinase